MKTTVTFDEMTATTGTSNGQVSSVMNEVMFLVKMSVVMGTTILLLASAWV